jgi:hypothetical protein
VKLKAKVDTALKPTADQTSDIKKRGMGDRIIQIKANTELKLLHNELIEGHQYVVLTGMVSGIDRGFFFAPSVEIIDDAINSSASSSKYPTWDLSMDFASRIIRFMMDKGYDIFDGEREQNIIYIEGVNPDGRLNSDRIDGWNDISCLISFSNNTPYFAMKPVTATTEPGRYYIDNPLHPEGAFRIAFGQQRAWRVGQHGTDLHSALVQVDNIRGFRDLNKDGSRVGDKLYVGYDMGVNHHGSYTTGIVGRSSAGCLVREYRSDHVKFMDLVVKDPQYIANADFMFSATVIDGTEFSQSKWGYR